MDVVKRPRKLAERNNARVTEGEENEQSSTPDYAFTTDFDIPLSFEISVFIKMGFLYACAHKNATTGCCCSIGILHIEAVRPRV